MSNTYQEAIENSNIVSKTDINGIITFVNDYKIVNRKDRNYLYIKGK